MTKVYASFFKASEKEGSGPDIHDLLLRLAENPDVAARERTLSRDVLIRLERLDTDGDYIVGEFCRKQTDNIPPSAGPNGLNIINLGEGNGLGYLAAFRYHLPTRTILLEQNKMSASHPRLSMYLKKIDPSATYSFSQVLRRDAWEKLEQGEVRRFKVSLATPRNLEALEAEGLSAAASARQLADIFEGVTISFEVGMGHNKKSNLNKGLVTRAAEKFLGAADVRSVIAFVADEDGTTALDFTGYCLRAEKEIGSDGADLAERYQARSYFLSEAFDANLAYLEELYRA